MTFKVGDLVTPNDKFNFDRSYAPFGRGAVLKIIRIRKTGSLDFEGDKRHQQGWYTHLFDLVVLEVDPKVKKSVVKSLRKTLKAMS